MKSKVITIIIISLVFTSLLLAMVLNSVSFWLVGLCTFIFVLSVAGYILTPMLKKHRQNNTVAFSDEIKVDINTLKKISTENHFYSNGIFYIINKEQKAIAIPFSDIVEVNKTLIKVNNRRFWKITAAYKNKTVNFKFRHNYTLWNKNFPKFLTELKRINPNAKVGKFNIWTL